MRKLLLAALAAFIAIALASCGDAPSAPDFVKKATKTILYQVEAGKIASEKAQSDTVKQFGRDMAETYGKLGEELNGIVQAEKLEVKLPNKLDRRQEKWIDGLGKVTPEKFDKTYAKLEVRALGRAAELLDRYAEEGGNAALKQFAANALSLVKRHLEEAKKLLQ